MRVPLLSIYLSVAAAGAAAGAPAGSALWTGVPMARDGSGTSWLPDETPMRSYHAEVGAWRLMVEGNAFLRYTNQDLFDAGERGDDELDAPGWVMAGAAASLGDRDLAGFRSMFSSDPLTEGGDGYPLLFQTGETWEDKPLVDRQHPHDLVGELALTWGHALGDDAGLVVYAALPGEPALGPPAFLHRPSAQNDPDAPLGHHWQDSTHISYGVATLGFRYKNVKVDGSAFNGREPDEDRYNVEPPRFDSWAGRLAINPHERVALQLSYGWLVGPERLEPGVNVGRTTASVVYAGPWGDGRDAAASFVWGRNSPDGRAASDSLLLEGNLAFGRPSAFGRAEYVRKTAGELAVRGVPARERYGIGALTLGGAYRFWSWRGAALAAGGQLTTYAVPAGLRGVYGATPVSAEVFLRLCPGEMKLVPAGMGEMEDMEGMRR